MFHTLDDLCSIPRITDYSKIRYISSGPHNIDHKQSTIMYMDRVIVSQKSSCNPCCGGVIKARDFRFPLRCRWEVRSSVILLSVEWYFCTDDSGQPICSIFKGQEVQEVVKNIRFSASASSHGLCMYYVLSLPTLLSSSISVTTRTWSFIIATWSALRRNSPRSAHLC
jgi:hypothetical protein